MRDFETASYFLQKTAGDGAPYEVRVIDENFEKGRGRNIENEGWGMPLGAMSAVERVSSMLPFDFCDWRGKSYKDFRDFCILMRERAESRARHFAETDCADFGSGDCGYIEVFVREWRSKIDASIQSCAARIADARKNGRENPLIDDGECFSELGVYMFDFSKFYKTSEYKALALAEGGKGE